MKARPRAKINVLTKYVGRRGGSWYNMAVVTPALSQDYHINRGDNHLGFRTVLIHRAGRAAPWRDNRTP